MEDYASQIVAEAERQGAQDAVAEVTTDRSYQIRFFQNQPAIANRWRTTTASVFLAVDRRVVAGEISNFSKIPERVAALVKSAKAVPENPNYAGIAKGPFQYGRVAVDKKIVGLEDGADYVAAAINGAVEEGAKETAGSFWRSHTEHYLETSNDVSARDERAHVYISLRALVGPESSGHGVSCATRLSQFDPERAGHKAGRIAALAKRPKGGKPGTYDVIFDPLIFGSLLDQVGGRASAWVVDAGLSPFVKKLGKRVASPALTLYDDATADTIGRRRFDAEGVPVKRKAIVQRGVLKTYLHNTSTAKKAKTRTTANAGLIAPEPFALVCQPGDWTRDEMFNEVKDGLWLTNTWYTRYQSYVTGDFSTIPRDGIFRIKNGEIAEVWKDIRLTDNLLGLFQRVKALSNKTEQVMWWYEVTTPTVAPYALATKVGITKSAM